MGDTAGHFTGRYIKVMIRGQEYYAHRLAWAHVYGVWPTRDLDHENENKTDNRIENLREATRSQNLINISAPNRNCKSGHRGVTRHHGGKWRAVFLGQHLGNYSTIDQAVAAYVAAKEQHGGME